LNSFAGWWISRADETVHPASRHISNMHAKGNNSFDSMTYKKRKSDRKINRLRNETQHLASFAKLLKYKEKVEKVCLY
jgi:hypothetical protein